MTCLSGMHSLSILRAQGEVSLSLTDWCHCPVLLWTHFCSREGPRREVWAPRESTYCVLVCRMHDLSHGSDVRLCRGSACCMRGRRGRTKRPKFASAGPQSSLCRLGRFQGAFHIFFWALQDSVSPMSLVGINSLPEFYSGDKHFLDIVSWYQEFFCAIRKKFCRGI